MAGEVWTCPSCGLYLEGKHDECPRCGVVVSKFLKRQKASPVEEPPIEQQEVSPSTSAKEKPKDPLEALRLQIVAGLVLVSIVLLIGGLLSLSTSSKPHSVPISQPVTAEDPKTRGMSCYEVGYIAARCVAHVQRGRKCGPEADFVPPKRCMGTSEMQRGIEAGARSMQ